jgi:hypothetical protein
MADLMSEGMAFREASEGLSKKHNPKYIEAQKRGKVDYSVIPWEVIALLAQAMQEGAEKYGRFNFLEDEIEARTYIASFCRHLFGDPSTGSEGWVNGEDVDEESGLPHIIKIMANCVVLEAARMHDKLIDNRLDTETKEPWVTIKPMIEDYEAAHPDMFRKDATLMDINEGPFDVVFVETNEVGDRLAEHRRGPFDTGSQADDYAQRNPERLPGKHYIGKHKGHTHAGN